MGFLDDVKDKATGAIETTKLNSKISSEQTSINAVLKQIGEFYYNKYLETKTADKGVKGFCEAIDGHNAAIAEAKAEIERIRIKTSTPAAAPGAAGGVVCPACGAQIASGMKFCAECGAKAPAPAPAPAATGGAVCPACGAVAAPGMKFCAECGAKITAPAPAPAAAAPAAETDDSTCPACGAEVPPGLKFCTGCGAKIEEKKRQKK